ncbi:MAG: hypothetical protein FD122_3726 [Stygiobacter sp.]|nr:MAG: hypothetical protein FD122_3726 [Stygiobacter sp.]
MNNLWKILEEDGITIASTLPITLFEEKTIIVTGATGLLGTHILSSLWVIKTVHKIPLKVFAIGFNDYPIHQEKIFSTEGFNFLRGDLTIESFCEKLPNADFIIHCATYGQPGLFLENPVKTIHLNTATTLFLFKKLLPSGRFLFLSSSEIYSGSTEFPYKETTIGNTTPLHPRACYIESKRTGEAIINSYRQKGVHASSARLALAYGPGTKRNDKRVLNSFIERAIIGTIQLADNGEAKRTYCYVTDAVEILMKILMNGKEPVYNVGGHSEITIADLAKMIGRVTGSTIIFPEQNVSLNGAPSEVVLDLSLSEKEFSKIKYVSLHEGLIRTIDWQRSLYSHRNQSTKNIYEYIKENTSV